MRTIGIVLFVVACVTLPAVAAEYWISPTGDDTGDGSMGNPWASVSRGAAFRANGTSAIGSSVINARNAEGFLPSGSLKVGGSTIAYSSITNDPAGAHFNLTGPLTFDVGNDAYINDAGILGGVGFQPGDIINLMGGEYRNQTLRLKASGSFLGGDITYRSAPGELAFLNIANRDVNTTRGGIWNDGESPPTKTEFVRLENFRVKIDQNFGCNACSAGAQLLGANSITFSGMDIDATGSLGDQIVAFRNVKGSSVAIENSKLRSRFVEAVRGDIGGTTTVSHTVIWGSRIGLSPINGPTITADHITFFGSGDSNLWASSVENGTVTITDSIVSGHPADPFNLIRAAFNGASGTASSDHTIFHNLDDNNYYAGVWSPGANDMPGQNGQPGVDPLFLETEDMDSPNWLRFDENSPAATASSTGSYVGAFAPVLSGGPACDFNSDTLCDDIDIDLLAAAVRNGTSDSQFNVDGLGDANIPDVADFDFYITDDSMLSTGFGDHDLNKVINFNDFVKLSNNFGGSGTGWDQGNGNTDNFTNFNDFVRLSNNFGMSFFTSDGANVPEPAALAILAMGALAVAGRRSWRK